MDGRDFLTFENLNLMRNVIAHLPLCFSQEERAKSCIKQAWPKSTLNQSLSLPPNISQFVSILHLRCTIQFCFTFIVYFY